MSSREDYEPGPALGAEIRKDGENWTLVLVRELCHPPTKVWQALTDPAHLREWAPFDADRSLAAVGPVTIADVQAIMAHRCQACHSATPTAFSLAPARSAASKR